MDLGDNMSMVLKKDSAINKEYPARDVFAASWAAYRLNGFQYLRPYNTLESHQMVNRERMLNLLEDTSQLSEEDYAIGEKMREHSCRFTMIALTRQLNSFEQMAAEASLLDTVKGNPHFAVITSLSPGFHREMQRRERSTRIGKLITGKHIGTIKQNIKIAGAKVITSQHSQKYLKCYTHAEYEGNLIGWWGDDLYNTDNLLNLNARVKEHCIWNSDDGPVPLTKLNYVRIFR